MSKFMNTVFPDMNSQYQYSQVALNVATSYSALEGALSLEESFMAIEPVSEGVWDSIQSFFKKIWDYICAFCNWVKKKAIAAYNWVKNLFKKKQAEKNNTNDKNNTDDKNNTNDRNNNDNKLLSSGQKPKLLNGGSNSNSGAGSNPNSGANNNQNSGSGSNISNNKNTTGTNIIISPWVEPNEIEDAANKCINLCTDILNESGEFISRLEKKAKDIGLKDDDPDVESKALTIMYDEVREYVDKVSALFDNKESEKSIPEKDFSMIEKLFSSLTASADKISDLATRVGTKFYKTINRREPDINKKTESIKKINSILKQPILDFAKKISDYTTDVTRAIAAKMRVDMPKNESQPVAPKATATATA